MNRFLLILLFSSLNAFAAGGGTVGGATIPAAPQKTTRELAIDNYHRGIAARDKAWKFQEEARQLTGLDDAKKIAKLEKKAQRAFKTAAKRFRQAVRYEPAFFQAHGSLGYALRQLGDYEASLAAYDESLALNPNYTEAIEYRGEAYLALGRLDDTRKAYMDLVRLDQARAEELMQAIQVFLENPPETVAPEAAASLKAWASERMQLGRVSSSSEASAKTDWTPASSL